jgi:tetratricopeptide (TPR) repeat protein
VILLTVNLFWLGCSQQGDDPAVVLEKKSGEKPAKQAADSPAEPAPVNPPVQWETPEEWVALMYQESGISQLKNRVSGTPARGTDNRRHLTVGSLLGMDLHNTNNAEESVFEQYHRLVRYFSIDELNAALKQAELISDPGEQAEAYCGITWALLDAEAFGRAKPWLVQGEKLIPRTQGTLKHEQLLQLFSKAYARSGDSVKAAELAQQITNFDLHEETMISIPEQITKTGDVEQALDFVETIKDRKSQSVAIRNMTRVLARSNACNQALSIAERITEEETRFQALEGIALELAKAGRGSQALEVVQQIKFLHRRPWFLRSLAKMLVKTGHLAQAQEVTPLIDGSRDQSTYLMEVGIAVAETGKPKQAREVVQQIPVRDTKETALAKVASALLKAGEVNGALEVTQQLEYDNQKVRLLYRIASALHSRGEDVRKITVLKEAVAASIRSGETPSLISAIGVLSMETRQTGQGTSTQLKTSFSPAERKLAEYLLQAAQQKQ